MAGIPLEVDAVAFSSQRPSSWLWALSGTGEGWKLGERRKCDAVNKSRGFRLKPILIPDRLTSTSSWLSALGWGASPL